jgi:hypothetical protein
MPRPETTILTKWGRLTGQQWIRARNREAMDAWLTDELVQYLADNWPTPQQIEDNCRRLAQEKRASRQRNATASAIASCARADRARTGSDSRARTAIPTQLAIL